MKIHFIGIGGIGISGLAKFMLAQGHEVSGSDISETVITKKLQELGMTLTIPHQASAITNQDLVIHSAIIRPDNIEVLAAKEKNIEVLARREALPMILKDKKVYAVCGAHGKSTTTAILSSILKGSAIIGAESKEFKDNVRHSDCDVLLFVADESDGSFLNSNPYCAIVPNAEPEHMEYYDYNFDRFYEAYRCFINSATLRVLNAEDPFLSTLECEAIRLYPSKDIKNIEYVLIQDEPHTRFELLDMGVFEVWGFGQHIAIDAALAILASIQSEDIEEVREKLLNFKGIKKRFDIINKNEAILIDDYGHHPTEIKATLESVKAYADLMGIDKITAIWQPHKYSRTIDNLDAFIKCFEGASELIILPVWAAGEAKRQINFEKDFERYSPLMADGVKRSNHDLDVIKDNKVLKSLDTGLIVGFGAGDITYQLRGSA
ncbi:UDP-N-acetylmuramate--L-alanine ligase [Sulfurimonas sp. MAG313]|nr:UDP-N-acetylmuramate--L-alanine ligase [Sulfurimonas sp. MAG313]MDF1880350.1 UDP-N-acetylmuramate--L-alanine ligase [Sulfurimonas sp. MAG313]